MPLLRQRGGSPLSHHSGSVEELLKSLFLSGLFEKRPVEYRKPRTEAEALSNLRDLLEKNFDPRYYFFCSRKTLLVWLPNYEEMLLNPRTRRSLDKIEQKLTAEVAVGNVAAFRKLCLDGKNVAIEFLALLDGPWLRRCLADRRDTQRERGATLCFLENSLGPPRRGVREGWPKPRDDCIRSPLMPLNR